MYLQDALAPYQHIEEDLKSLKEVLEMKNQQIHDQEKKICHLEKVVSNKWKGVKDKHTVQENCEIKYLPVFSLKLRKSISLCEKRSVPVKKTVQVKVQEKIDASRPWIKKSFLCFSNLWPYLLICSLVLVKSKQGNELMSREQILNSWPWYTVYMYGIP